jgi:hypothetical protein
VNDLKPVTDLVKDLSKTGAIVSTVHLCKTEQHMLQVPLAQSMFLNPVSCDSKIRVRIVCLPSVTGQADLPTDSGALASECQ